MKKVCLTLSTRLKFVLFVSAAALLMASCNKDDDGFDNQSPVAGLMAFNLAPDQNNVAFTISNNYLGNTTYGYTSFTGSYLPIYTGDREVRSADYTTGNTLAIGQKNFLDSNYYSVFLVGYGGGYRNIITTDTLLPLTAVSGKAWVRYVNAVTDSTATSTVNISTGSEVPINEPASYAHVSGFKQISAGSVNTSISGGSFSTSRTITLEENKIYTVLFVGDPGETDEMKKVQVKFITNGIVTP